MMVSFATGITFLVSMSAAPPSKAPNEGESAPAMSVTLRVEGGPPGLLVFLVQRARETWDTSVEIAARGAAPEDGTDPSAFRIAVDWHGADQLSVSVRRGEALLTDRTIAVTDPVHALLTLWLLLKSTIERYRALAADLPKEATDATDNNSDTAPASLSKPTANTAVVAAAGAPRAKVGETVTATPESTGPLALRWGAMVTVWLETPRLLAVGVAGVATWRGETVALGAQLGYRFTPGPNGLAVHGLPLTGTASVEMGDRVRAGIGVMLTGELKVPVSSAGTSLEVGAEAGLFAQARIEISERSLAFLRLAHAWRIVRKRYRYHDGAGSSRRTREAPWASMISTGVEWL